MRVRLASRFDYRIPGKRAIVSYEAAPNVLMPHAHAAAAIAAGVAEEIKPKKGEAEPDAGLPD